MSAPGAGAGRCLPPAPRDRPRSTPRPEKTSPCGFYSKPQNKHAGVRKTSVCGKVTRRLPTPENGGKRIMDLESPLFGGVEMQPTFDALESSLQRPDGNKTICLNRHVVYDLWYFPASETA